MFVYYIGEKKNMIQGQYGQYMLAITCPVDDYIPLCNYHQRWFL